MLKSDVTSDASGFFEILNDTLSLWGRAGVGACDAVTALSPNPSPIGRGDRITFCSLRRPTATITRQLSPARAYMLNCAPFFRGCWYRYVSGIAFIAINDLRHARRRRPARRHRFFLDFLQERLSRFRKGCQPGQQEPTAPG